METPAGEIRADELSEMVLDSRVFGQWEGSSSLLPKGMTWWLWVRLQEHLLACKTLSMVLMKHRSPQEGKTNLYESQRFWGEHKKCDHWHCQCWTWMSFPT